MKKTLVILVTTIILSLSIPYVLTNYLTTEPGIDYTDENKIKQNIKIETSETKNQPQSIEKTNKKSALSFSVPPDPSALLLFGVDYLTKGEKHGRSDTIILALTSPSTKEIALLSIPRDTYIKIPGHGYNKINTAFQLGGPELTSKTVSEWLDISIENTVSIDYKGFTKIVDILGGLEVNVEKTMKSPEFTLEKGERTLSGEEVLNYVRFRKSIDGNHDSDYQRMERQQQILSNLTDKVISFQSLSNTLSLIHTVNESINTTLNLKEMITLGRYYHDFSISKLHTTTFQGYGDKKSGIWYEIIPEDEFQEKKAFIDNFLSG